MLSNNLPNGTLSSAENAAAVDAFLCTYRSFVLLTLSLAIGVVIVFKPIIRGEARKRKTAAESPAGPATTAHQFDGINAENCV